MKFLLTAIGGDIAQSIIRVLRKIYPNSLIVGVDCQPQPFFANFVDEFVEIPSASDKFYLDTLSTLISNKKIEILIPVSEPEITLITRSGYNFGVPTVICNKKSIEICSDKLLTSKFLSELGPFSPTTSAKLEEYAGDFPVIVKPRYGSGSKGIRVCETLEEASIHGLTLENPIFQELLTPSEAEVTCGVFRSSSGETRVIQLQRVLSGGRTLWAELIEQEDVYRVCSMIAQKLDLVGSVNIQLVMTKRGPRIFEINPRISSTVEMREHLGFQDLYWSVEEVLGRSTSYNVASRLGTLVGRTDRIITFSDRSLH